MPVCRALVFSLLWVIPAWGAELHTLTGSVITGDLVGVSDKELVIQKGAERITTPQEQVLDVILGQVANPPAGAKYTDVLLTDGSLFHCSRLAIRAKEARLTLLSEQEVKVSLDAIHFVQKDAQDAAVVADWKERFLGKKRSHDLLIVKSGDKLESLDGTLGEADGEGKTIEFILTSGKKYNAPLDRIQGMIFERGPDPNLAPVLCRLYDVHDNLLYVGAIAPAANGFSITTSAGMKIDYPRREIARLDYSKGRLTFLSDDAFWKAGKVKVSQSSTEEWIEKPRRDKNLDDGEIRLGGAKRDRGLALHSHTELEFDLGGDYREFKALAGVDELVGGDGPVVLKIEGDGKELYATTMTRKDKPKPLTLNIKDVQRLRITVTSGDLLDLGKHLDLAEARVSK